MSELFRVYSPWECMGDGYPDAWHKTTAINADGFRVRVNLLVAEEYVGLSPPIKDVIRDLRGHRCERCGHPYAKGEHPMTENADGEMESWSPCDDRCRHGGPIRVRWTEGDEWQLYEVGAAGVQGVATEAIWRILTVHHLDENKRNCRWWNLVALCQRCHLRMQRGVVMGRPYHFEHSDWFKPYAAGFYAWKYLGEDLDREQTMSRLDELLALEHRFTQEVLL